MDGVRLVFGVSWRVAFVGAAARRCVGKCAKFSEVDDAARLADGEFGGTLGSRRRKRARRGNRGFTKGSGDFC